MGWLIAIWAFAALCGWLVYVAYQPVLEIATSLAYSVAPELSGPIAALASTPGLRSTAAVGVALVIGLALSLVWVAAKAIRGAGRSVTAPSPRKPGANEPASDWQIDAGEAARTPSRTEPAREQVVAREERDPIEPRSTDPFDQQIPGPRWGRQPSNERGG